MNVSRACRRLLTVIILLAGHPAVEAQDADDSRGVGVRPTLVFGALAEQAPQGNAGMFVGVNQFTRDDGLNELAYAVHDAVELAHLFVNELKLVPPANCYLLLSGEPSSESVKQHLAQLRAAGAKVSGADRSKILLTFLDLRKFATNRENLFVCSFSSHGFNEGRTAYVMPSDGHRELLSDTAVPLETIETKMEDSKAGHRLLLVDACQERVSARSSSSAGKAAEAAFIDALRMPSGQAKLASCSPGEFSFEHGSLGGVGHGVFTHSFLEALRGGAKPDDENLVRLGAVSDYVAASVSSWTKELGRTRQTPFLESPVEAKALPLATRADDLTTLIATVQRQPLAGELTEELRGRIVAALRKVNPTQAADRQFLTNTRDFVQGRFNAGLYIPYARTELDRLVPAPPALLIAPFSENAARTAQAAWAKFLRTDVDLSSPRGMKLKLIPPGEFLMGSDDTRESLQEAGFVLDEKFDPSDEHPRHRVRITRPFHLGLHEVTKGQFAAFVRDTGYRTEAEKDGKGGYGYDPEEYFKQAPEFTWKNTGFSQSDSHPVVNVSWNDAVEYCNWLSRQEDRAPCYRRQGGTWDCDRSADGYRLPTEAEWEYACKAGTDTRFVTGNGPNSLQGHANVRDASFKAKFPRIDYTKFDAFRFDDGWEFTAPAGHFRPNGFGVYDLTGNVWEWCGDWYAADYYASSPGSDPPGPGSGSSRVLRGGSWLLSAIGARSANRYDVTPDYRYYNVGFRVVAE